MFLVQYENRCRYGLQSQVGKYRMDMFTLYSICHVFVDLGIVPELTADSFFVIAYTTVLMMIVFIMYNVIYLLKQCI